MLTGFLDLANNNASVTKAMRKTAHNIARTTMPPINPMYRKSIILQGSVVTIIRHNFVPIYVCEHMH